MLVHARLRAGDRVADFRGRSLRAARACCVLLLPLAVACGGGAPNSPTLPHNSTPVLTSVTVLVSAVTIGVGQTTTATAIGYDQNGAIIEIGTPSWTSDAPIVASVSADGLVRGSSPGQASIVATANGKTGRAALTVLQIPVARVTVSPAEVTLDVGSTQQLKAETLDANGRTLAGRVITWTSADSARATVSPSGLVQAIAVGAAPVTATSEGVKVSSLVFATSSAPGAVARVELTPPTDSLLIGESLQLTASLQDSDGNEVSVRDISWSLGGANASRTAKVSSDGVVTAIAAGTVTVTASSAGRRGVATVVVHDNLDARIVVAFGAPITNSTVGDTLRIQVSVKSAEPLASVVASLGAAKLTLEKTFVGALGLQVAWIGSMDITDIPWGPHVLTVLATDVTGAFGRGAVPFNRDTRVGTGGSKPPPKNK